ncbi:MAG: hypothetical protein WA973_16420 [Mesorhizobium sp.]
MYAITSESLTSFLELNGVYAGIAPELTARRSAHGWTPNALAAVWMLTSFSGADGPLECAFCIVLSSRAESTKQQKKRYAVHLSPDFDQG